MSTIGVLLHVYILSSFLLWIIMFQILHKPYHKQQRRKSNLLRQNVMLPEGQAGADGGCRILKIPWLCADNKEYKTNIQGKKTIVWMCTWSVILYGYETGTMIKDVDTFEMWFYWRLTRSSWTVERNKCAGIWKWNGNKWSLKIIQ